MLTEDMLISCAYQRFRSPVQVEDFCNRIHKGIMKQFKYALVWGTSVKHKPQKVGRDHVLDDEDIVQIVKKI